MEKEKLYILLAELKYTEPAELPAFTERLQKELCPQDFNLFEEIVLLTSLLILEAQQ